MKAKLAYAIWPWGLSSREQTITAIREIKEIGRDQLWFGNGRGGT